MSESAGKMRARSREDGEGGGRDGCGRGGGTACPEHPRAAFPPAPTWSTRWTISLVWWNAPGPS